jgi:hypothetical protein
MFIPCIVRRIINDQKYALICTTHLFYVLVSTCFGRSILDPSEGSSEGSKKLPDPSEGSSEGSKKLPDDDRLLPKHVGTST